MRLSTSTGGTGSPTVVNVVLDALSHALASIVYSVSVVNGSGLFQSAALRSDVSTASPSTPTTSTLICSSVTSSENSTTTPALTGTDSVPSAGLTSTMVARQGVVTVGTVGSVPTRGFVGLVVTLQDTRSKPQKVETRAAIENRIGGPP